ncbi:MAG: PhoH family protein, partial [Planctomycetota bacterium]
MSTSTREQYLGIRALPDTQSEGESLIEFPDNRLLQALCGEFDRNLAQIEQGVGIQIVRRGNQLVIIGEPAGQEAAAEVLNDLYSRLEAGRDVEPGDIDASMRLAGQGAGKGRSNDQMELFQGGRVEVKTRKKIVEPRTEAQKAYVRALFEKELAFGIGPAGTGKTYLAVAVGVNMFLGGHVDRIILSRPAVEAGERLGFLPGDMKDKVDPYMQPLYDALNDFLPGKQVTKLIEEKQIEI